MNLLINYFKPPNLQRHSEYLTCLHENLNNPLIEKIHVFVSDGAKVNILSPKVVLLEGPPPTFKVYFDYCYEFLKGQVCIIANSDIFFDETMGVLKDIPENVFVALTRWEISKDSSLKPMNNATSQDVWAFRAPVKTREDMNFPLGIPGGDNRIAKIMHELGYEVRNPGLQIVTGHFHLSGYRKKLRAKVPGPYLLLTPNDDINKKTEYTFVDDL